MSKQAENPVRIEKVPEQERRKLTDMSHEVRKTREQRRALETTGVDTSNEKAAREIKPTKVRLPASPIVGKASKRFDKTQAPPKPQLSPTGDPSKTKPERRPETDKIRPKAKIQQDPKRETRQEPQTKEPKHQTREASRQPERISQEKAREPDKRGEKTKNPSSVKKPETDKENPGQPDGKDRKKER
jgi:hypothetical protein